MVAKITTPGSISKALNYNEKKVQKGVAGCLYAGNFLKDAGDMNFYEKLAHFKRLIDLNTRAKTNTLHISLNFPPSENLGQKKLLQIAAAYMNKIGFGEQPYLVYEHKDAGHPHLHIVTTSIQENGKRIVTQNIGRNESEKARKEIEETFGLIKASEKNQGLKNEEEKTVVQKIRYGKEDTKQSITAVLRSVINRYHYSSLHELNAVLGLYNVIADRGTEGSRTYQRGGLTYSVLDDKGGKIGIPIKASSIPFKPTLPYLELQFKKGEEARRPFKQKLATAIEFTLQQRPDGMDRFVQKLREEKVTAILRKNGQGYVYGVTFIDHRTGCVFNGSDLGKGHSAAAIQQRLLEGAVSKVASHGNLLESKKSGEVLKKPLSKKEGVAAPPRAVPANGSPVLTEKSNSLLDELMGPEKGVANVPYEFRKKKKKRRGLNL